MVLVDITAGPSKGRRCDMATRQAKDAIARGWAVAVVDETTSEPPADPPVVPKAEDAPQAPPAAAPRRRPGGR